MVLSLLSLHILVGLAYVQRAAPAAISLSPPTAAPSDAVSVAQGFIAFGIEARDFQDYTGNDTTANEFSRNMFQTFTNKTGAPVNLRVGGTSGDNIIYDPNQTLAVNNTGTPNGLHTNITLGTSWVAGFARIPNANWTIQVPLARRNPVDNVIAFANACINAVPGGLQAVEVIEIGNEPDLYSVTPTPNTDRPSTYGPADYAKEWQALGQALESSIPALNASQPRYQARSLSSGSKWHMSDIFEAGINAGGMAKLAAQHYYQIISSGTLQGSLMNHTHTVDQVQTQFQSDINFIHANFSKIPYILGEVGSSLQPGSPTVVTIDQSLGNALWTVDFLLHAMTVGIARVNMQLGNFAFSAWGPADTTAPVCGNFYGHVFVADLIGTQGALSVAPLAALPSAQHPNLVGYVGYAAGALSKLALLDLAFWEEGNATGVRPAQTFTLNVGADVTQVRVERLTAPDGATALQPNITWAGNLWSQESNGLPQLVKNDTTIQQVVNGMVEGVTIQASEALLLTLMRG